jgi:FkbM family methyltransferase
LNPSFKYTLKRARRRLAEAVGIDRYSHLALNGLDRKLARFLPHRGGFFIEAGANDGLAQSNTYYFERMRGWSGLLIEPVPELCARCRRERPRSKVVQAALVGQDYPHADVEMQYAGLMSVIEGAFGDPSVRSRHVELGLQQPGVDGTYSIRVPARTLSAIIDAEAGGRDVDLLSLDVEGAELQALAGLNLARHAPHFICVEARDPRALTALLRPRYEQAEVLSDNGEHQDILFRRR